MVLNPGHLVSPSMLGDLGLLFGGGYRGLSQGPVLNNVGKKKFPIWLCAMDIKYMNIVLHLPGNIFVKFFPLLVFRELVRPGMDSGGEERLSPLVPPGDPTLSGLLSLSVD